MASMTLHENADAAGALLRTRLRHGDDAGLTLACGEDVLPLPDGALDAVMKRYGKPLAIGGDSDAAPRDVDALRASGVHVDESIDLGAGQTLARFRFLRRYDVIARDYLVLFAPGEEPLCELAAAVTAALDHLARRFACVPRPLANATEDERGSVPNP